MFGLRDPAKAGEYAATGPRDAAESADAVVIAVPYGAVPDVAAGLGPLTGKIVIDATNPLIYSDGARELAVGFDTSAGEQLQALLPEARVVKALNQVGFGVMEDASGFVHPPVMFMAGDDDAAKETVAGLLSDIGFEPIDAGALRPLPAAGADGDGVDQPDADARTRPELGVRGAAAPAKGWLITPSIGSRRTGRAAPSSGSCRWRCAGSRRQRRHRPASTIWRSCPP